MPIIAGETSCPKCGGLSWVLPTTTGLLFFTSLLVLVQREEKNPPLAQLVGAISSGSLRLQIREQASAN